MGHHGRAKKAPKPKFDSTDEFFFLLVIGIVVVLPLYLIYIIGKAIYDNYQIKKEMDS